MSLTPNSNTPDSKQSKQSNKSKRSPFLVDLLAESERIDEECQIRRARNIREKRAEQAKIESIPRASQEPNELEELRKQKRKILEEEKRLKALIELEKTNSHRKNDRQAAQIAERKRHVAKLEKRRIANKEEIAKREEARINMIRLKHSIKSPKAAKSDEFRRK